jgi:hypothetical protein
VDLQMHMDWHRGRSIISDRAGGTVEENGALGMLKSKVLVPVEWSVWIGRTWRGVFEVVKTWDNKLLKFLEKRIYTNIRSDLIKLWVVDGMKKKGIARERQHNETHKVFGLLDQNNDTSFYLHNNQEMHK